MGNIFEENNIFVEKCVLERFIYLTEWQNCKFSNTTVSNEGKQQLVQQMSQELCAFSLTQVEREWPR